MNYERSKQFDDFHIAGFAYYDGLHLLDTMKVGTLVTLVKEAGNPYDDDAIVILLGNRRIGYVPRSHNETLAQLLYFGHHIFEAYISSMDLTQNLERQIRVSVFVKDNRG